MVVPVVAAVRRVLRVRVRWVRPVRRVRMARRGRVLVVSVVLIYFWCQPGDPLPNAYGPPPPMFDPSQRAAMPL